MDVKKTGLLIKNLRTEKGLTQSSLAETLNISNRTVSKWENGDGLPDIGILPELAAVLGVTTDELLAGEMKEKPPEPIQQQVNYPFFQTQGHYRIKDQVMIYKYMFKDTLPVWLRASVCLGLIAAFFGFLKLTHNEGTGSVAVLGIIFSVALLHIIFMPQLSARTKTSQVKAANGGILPNGSFTMSDRVYISGGTEQHIFNLQDITAFFEDKNYFILRFHKNVYCSVNKSEFVYGTPEQFSSYLRSFVINKKKPFYLKALQICISLQFILLCIVFSALIALPNTPSMTEESIAKSSEIEIYNEFYKSTYANNSPYSDLGGTSDINEKERAAVLVTEFYDEFENGGLCQYFCNSSGRYAYELESNLREAGLNELADEYAKIISEYHIDLNRYKVSVDYDSELKKYDFDTIDNRLDKAVVKSDIPIAVGEYIKNHSDSFSDDFELNE